MISTEYFAVLPNGETIYGSMDELLRVPNKIKLQPKFDGVNAGAMMVRASKTIAGREIIKKHGPNQTQYEEKFPCLLRYQQKR